MKRQKKIRILHVAQSAGGVDQYIRMLLKYINHERFENILVCSYDYKEEDYIGLLEDFEQINMHREICIDDVKAICKVRKLICKYKPDIVYAHSSKAGAIARIANVGIKNTCIYNPHGWAFNMRCSKQKQVVYTMIERVAAKFCKKIICISETEKKSAIRNRICCEEKLQVIYNGIDIEKYETQKVTKITKQALNIPKSAFVIGMVGRISQQKAPDVFIKAANLIKKNMPNAYFIIVGDGEQKKQILEYAEKVGLQDDILITGWVNNAMDYIQLFDIAMLLSRWEGFGLVLPEYMMASKPIIASRVDAIPDIIRDNENGLLVDVDDPEGVYEAVVELYKNEPLRNKLITQGKKDVYNRFNAKRVADEHMSYFEKIVKH